MIAIKLLIQTTTNVLQLAVTVAHDATQETPQIKFGRYSLKLVDKDVTVKGSYGIVYIVEVACICITLFKNPLCSYIAIAYIIMYVGKVVTDKQINFA